MLEFIKGFLTLFLLVKVLLYFVPKKMFEKYISFFAGVILVIGLLYPLLLGLGQEERILEKLQNPMWEEELFAIVKSAEQLEETGQEVVEEYYGRLSEETDSIETVVIEHIKIENTAQAGEEDE